MATVAFFATCLVDNIMPEVGASAVRLLRMAGYKVVFPPGQTCCGQPFYNSGLREEALPLARHTIEIFEPYEAVVLPSGSCTAMLRVEYPHLFADDPLWLERALALGRKTFELTEFLVHQAQWTPPRRPDAPTVTYHDSCHMYRMLGLHEEPRRLLRAAGYNIVEMKESAFCCGFGGLFSVRLARISNAITADKLRMAMETTAPILVTADPGCLMQMRGMLKGTDLRVEHVAVMLAHSVNSGNS